MSSESDRAGPLQGLKVLELSVARAGPVAARQLADLGAEVIKVELPETMEEPVLRSASFRNSSDFQNLNRGRKGITVNLKHAGGITALRRMADQCDIVIENFRPNVKKRLGFDYDTLSRTNPRLIYASLSGFGQDGPYADRPGVDQILQGMGGLMSVTGHPDSEPTRVGVAIVDFTSGMMLSFGVLAAVCERNRSGRGQWVTTSLLQNQVYLMDFQAARWLQDRQVPGPEGNNHPTFRPTGLFRARDALINIAPGPHMWPRFCAAIGLDALAEHPDYATNEARYANSERLSREIEAVTMTQDAQVWVDRLNAAGVPCGPLNRMDQVFEDAQVRHLEVIHQVHSESLGPIDQVRMPLDFSRTPAAFGSAAPTRGQHTREVLRDFGFTDGEIASLEAEGAV